MPRTRMVTLKSGKEVPRQRAEQVLLALRFFRGQAHGAAALDELVSICRQPRLRLMPEIAKVLRDEGLIEDFDRQTHRAELDPIVVDIVQVACTDNGRGDITVASRIDDIICH